MVAFGTSSPELAVSLKASLGGQTDIAIGNVVGSNIFNVLFILGVSALVTPLVVSSQLIRVDVPIMILVSVALLFLGLIGYIVWSIYQSRKETAAGQQEFAHDSAETPKRTSGQMVLQIGLILGGLLLLTLDCRRSGLLADLLHRACHRPLGGRAVSRLLLHVHRETGHCAWTTIKRLFRL